MRSPELVASVLQGLKGGDLSREFAVDLLRKINQRTDVAVIGIGVAHPGGDDYESLWTTWASGGSYIRRCPLDRLEDAACLVPPAATKDPWLAAKGGYLEDLDLFDCGVFGFDQHSAEHISPRTRLSLATAYRALEDAGMAGEGLADNDMAVIVGYNHTKEQLGSFLELVYKNTFAADPLNQQLGSWTSGIASRISMFFDLHGPSYVVDASCPSSLVPVVNAYRGIANGDFSTALVGGLYVDFTPVHQYTRFGFSMAQSDDTATKLFDRHDAGSFGGEFCGFVVLKKLERAVADGDAIHCVIRGVAINNNGAEGEFMSSSPKSIAKAVRAAVESAEIDPEDIGLFLGEGYSGGLETALELAGQAAGFRQLTKRNQFCAMNALTGTLGYVNSGIGIANLIGCSLAIEHRHIPGLPHFDSPMEEADLLDSPFYVPPVTQLWEPPKSGSRAAMAYSYGFGGSNVLAVVQEAPLLPPTPAAAQGEVLYCVSAASRASLKRRLDAEIQFLADVDEEDFRAFCYTACCRTHHHGHERLAVLAVDRDELLARLREFRRTWSPAAGVVHATLGRGPLRKRMHPLQGRALIDCAQAFVDGDSLTLSELFAPEDQRFIRGPAYPFDMVRCWPKRKEVNRLKLLIASLVGKPAGFVERINR